MAGFPRQSVLVSFWLLGIRSKHRVTSIRHSLPSILGDLEVTALKNGFNGSDLMTEFERLFKALYGGVGGNKRKGATVKSGKRHLKRRQRPLTLAMWLYCRRH